MAFNARSARACALVLVLCAVPVGATDSADADSAETDSAGPESTTPAEGDSSGFTIVDTRHVRVVAKNVRQEDESGDSEFGIGLDWRYAFEREFPRAEDGPVDPLSQCKEANSLAFNVSLSGKGFVSLNDPHTGADDAKEASNFDSITNRLRYAGFWRSIGPCERVERPPTNPAEMKAWKERTREQIRRQVERDAEGYVAVDFGFHAETESDQTFDNTQVALGGSATMASGLVAQYLLYPLKFLVPQRGEGYGDVVQSPQLFLGFEQVVGASYRRQLDGASNEDFTRFRLEFGWTSELLLPGLFPFAHVHFYQELDPEAAIRAAGKASTRFYELGVNYYVGDRIEAIRNAFGEGSPLGTLARNANGMNGVFSQGSGPFVTIRYAAGELPPYLESDHQASLGFGIAF